MNSTEERVIKIFNQMDCPACGKKLEVRLTTKEIDGCLVVIPTSSCCSQGSQYVLDNYQQVYNQAFIKECRDIISL